MTGESMMNLKVLGVAAIATLALTASADAANLVVNGDFEAGNIGFISDYQYVSGPNSATPPAVYAIDTSPRNVHDLWSNFGDHTTGDGLMMIVNGSLTSGDRVWQEENLSVLPNTTYYFSTWIAASFPASPALLDFSINGEKLGETFTANAAPGTWQQFFATWNSGANTTATLALVNQNTAFGGNDFALDDIVLDTIRPGIVPEPATWGLMITGFAGIGCLLRRRRAQDAFAAA